jgi:hypothetical protein
MSFRGRWLLLILLAAIPAAAQVRIVSDPDTLVFQSVKLGFSRDAIVKINNISAKPVHVTDIFITPLNSNPGEFQVISPSNKDFTIDSFQYRNITLRFKPDVEFRRTALLTVVTDDGDLNVQLIGDVTDRQPDVNTIPSEIDFGIVVPGELKDTTYLIVGGGIDSVLINFMVIENDNGGIYFNVYPEDPTVTFPVLLGPRDTLVMHAVFNSFAPDGVKTGRALAKGAVSGQFKCEFRGKVGSPELEFSPQVLDLGIVPLSTSVDSVITLRSIGEAALHVENILTPVDFQVTPVPNLPLDLVPGQSLRFNVHFDATTLGSFDEALGVLVKITASGGKYREVRIKALVLPNEILVESPPILTISCISRTIDTMKIRLTDTSAKDAIIDKITVSNPRFTLSPAIAFPLVIGSSMSQDIPFAYNPNGVASGTDSGIVEFYYGDYVLLRDTLRVSVNPESLDLATNKKFVQPKEYEDNVAISGSDKIASFFTTSIVFDLTIDPPDLAEVDILKRIVLKNPVPNVQTSVKYDDASKTYKLTLAASSGTVDFASANSFELPLRFFVTSTAQGMLHINGYSPDNEGCVIHYRDSVVLRASDQCGDPIIRDGYNGALMANFIGSSQLNGQRNPHISFQLSRASEVRLYVYDLLGNELTSASLSPKQGTTSYDLTKLNLTSGVIIVRLTALDVFGNKATVSRKYLISE